MADAAIARREARRRRILENSHNRLQLISGKIDDDFCRDSPRTSTPEQNVDIPFMTEVNTVNTCYLNNGALTNELETLGFTSTDNEINDEEVTNDLAAFLSQTHEPTPTQDPSIVDKLFNNKYDIVLLSLSIQLANGLSIFTVGYSYLFLPLFLYVLTKFIFFPKPTSNTNIANVLLLLNGFSAGKVKVITYIMQLGMLFSRDVCVFLFTTICIQSLYTVLQDSLTT